ncbi:MAG TPA: malectin domain-containing carbohydrate-binding protein, partial [Verrucomicrobiae bacterium]|nr:malectin domain-containing carbohydrate-binding protein [Verrucomicrobiae bacterium]
MIPDQQESWVFPILDIRESPLFNLRGIQPFHDFPEGPDWWNRDEYLAMAGQLAKLRMNFFGLHTYPEDRPNAEPTVWIGFPNDLGPHGSVRFSYPASYQNTLRGNWGYSALKTSSFACGTDRLFERDAFGPETPGAWLPQPASSNACNEVFNRTATMLGEAFAFAHQLGIKTCVGTETPLIIPKAVQARARSLGKEPAEQATVQQIYEGIFQRAAAAYPLDYYWFWTPEGWTWSGVKDEEIAATTSDLRSALAAWQKVHPPFRLATCGWVLGPPQDRALFDKLLPKEIAVSCINRQVGYTPVEAGFAQVTNRSKWAIPWMEDDPALTSPQLWVGRMRRDAADALRYGCDGLMGIHWRTRILGPNVSALAQAAWNQRPWVDTCRPASQRPALPLSPGPVGGQTAGFPNNPITGTDDPILYQTVRYNLSGYHLAASNGLCRVTLKFCEPHYNAAGERVFDVQLQGATVITNLDVFARVGKNRALDFTFESVAVTNGWLDIGFLPRVEFPSIAALEVDGEQFSTRINCGGPAHGDFAADAPGTTPETGTFAETDDFYLDWARHEFGEQAGPPAARIFARLDCHLPIPSVWTDGPGGIKPDARAWDSVKKDYGFVDDFGQLHPLVKGRGNQERFGYWLNTFRYFRAIAELNCAWGEYERVLATVKALSDAPQRKSAARDYLLPARRRLIDLTSVLFQHLTATVSTTGELGTVANWNQHNLPALLGKPGEELTDMLGEPLPPDCRLDGRYHGPTRIIVPALRTSL